MHWMNPSEVGCIIAKLSNVLVYVYYKMVGREGEVGMIKRTTVYRPNRDVTEVEGFLPINNQDKHKSEYMVRLHCQLEDHFLLIKWGTVKTEVGEKVKETVNENTKGEGGRDNDATYARIICRRRTSSVLN